MLYWSMKNKKSQRKKVRWTAAKSHTLIALLSVSSATSKTMFTTISSLLCSTTAPTLTNSRPTRLRQSSVIPPPWLLNYPRCSWSQMKTRSKNKAFLLMIFCVSWTRHPSYPPLWSSIISASTRPRKFSYSERNFRDCRPSYHLAARLASYLTLSQINRRLLLMWEPPSELNSRAWWIRAPLLSRLSRST